MISLRFMLCAALLAVAIWGQDYRSTITGTLTDPSGASIPGAAIVATNEATKVAYRSTSNEAGVFQISFVQPGVYEVTAEAPGFKKLDRPGLVAQVGQRVELNLVLEIGTTSDSVTIMAEVPILDTGSADLGTVVDQSYMDRQPIVGRNVMNMVSYAPGIVGGVGAYGTAAQKDFSINGSAQGSNEVTVDGHSVVLPRGRGTLGNVPLTEAVQEFKVHTTMFDAAMGRSEGGAVSIVTRGGTNEPHGSFYNYWRPNALRANTWTNNRSGQDLATTGFKLYGGTVGGPVLLPKVYDGRNRTFFFLSMEQDSDVRAQTWQARVPVDAERQGDFSQTLGSRGGLLAVYDPDSTVVTGSKATRQVFPGNRIPVSRMNETGRAVMALFPQPNQTVPAQIGALNWVQSANVIVDEKNFGLRMDHSFSDRYRLMGRFGLMRREAGPSGVPKGMSSAQPTGGTALDSSDRRFRSLTLNNDYTLSPSSVLNVRFGYIRYFIQGASVGTEKLDPALMKLPGIITANQVVSGWSVMNLGENVMSLGGTSNLDATDSYSVSSSATKLRGKHSLVAGGEWRIGRYNTLTPGSASTGTFTFNNTFTRSDPFTSATGQTSGTSLASLLLGIPASGSFGYNSALSVLNHYVAIYFKDDWRVRPRLTLNLGLRWEMEMPWKERYDRISYDFDRSAKIPVAVPGRELIGGLRFVNEKGLARYQGRTDLNNFGPRFGFAFEATKKTVLRGGYGIFYSTGSLGSDYLGAVNSFNAVTPYVASIDGGATAFTALASPFPNGLRQPAGRSLGRATELGSGVSFFESGRVQPYTGQWQFSVQRELPFSLRLQAAYIGTLSVKQFETFDLNELPDRYRALGAEENVRVPNPFYGVFPATTTLGASSTVAQRVFWLAYPQFTSVSLNGANTGRAVYHSLQSSVEKRFSHGVSFMWNHTWSKTMDNNTTSIVNDRSWYRTVGSADKAHLMRFIFNLDLPFGPGKPWGHSAGRVWGRVIGGWSVSGRWNYESGTPLSITDTNGRPIRIANPKLTGSVRSRLGDRSDPVTGKVLNSFFNIDAFRSLPNQYTVSPEPPVFNELRGPSSSGLDAVLSKEMRVRERFRVGFRFEAYAATNTPIFSKPGTDMANRTTFGVINSVGGTYAGRIIGVDGARTIQIASEVRF